MVQKIFANAYFVSVKNIPLKNGTFTEAHDHIDNAIKNGEMRCFNGEIYILSDSDKKYLKSKKNINFIKRFLIRKYIPTVQISTNQAFKNIFNLKNITPLERAQTEYYFNQISSHIKGDMSKSLAYILFIPVGIIVLIILCLTSAWTRFPTANPWNT